MSRVVFVGYLYSEQLLDSINKWGSRISSAAYTFQKAFLKGLTENGYEYEVVSMPLVEPFPKIPKLFFPTSEFVWGGKNNGLMLGMINLPIIRLFSWRRRLSKVLKKVVKGSPEDLTIIIYGVTSYSLGAIKRVRKDVSHVHMIAPDLPEYMSGSTNLFYRFAKQIDRVSINKNLSAVDSFSFLTKYMKDKLPIDSKPWVLLEGIYEDGVSCEVKKEDGFCFLYTGTLNARYGIMDLVSAFSLIQGEEYQLWICGYGDSLDSIKNASIKDSRIQYLGVKGQDEIRHLQKKATFLVNPRHSSEEYTKYSFPSKTMEYLASGTPTIMCRLPGIPEDYYEHLFFFDDETIDGFKNTMIEVTKLPKQLLIEKGALAASFVKEKKNCRVQSERVMSLINQS